jgi:hypothetical protein
MKFMMLMAGGVWVCGWISSFEDEGRVGVCALASRQLLCHEVRMSGDERCMMRAIELARQGMRRGDGGPFGAVVLREGIIIGEGGNQVLFY